MPHKLTFFPIGNADTCLVNLDNGMRLLFDFAHCERQEDDADPRINLHDALLEELSEQDEKRIEVVAFTHADDDHIRGATDFFELDHAQKYQSSERVKISELWVPAAFICETGLTGEGRILQKEARHRLQEGYGVRVFSRPEALRAWFDEQALDLQDRLAMISDAGTLVPSLEIARDGVEVFVHSPFAFRQEEDMIDRNADSIVVQLTFLVNQKDTRVMLGADTPYERWQDIVNITKTHSKESRLLWDVFKLPHHCSYLSLGPEKGSEKTEPVEETEWLFGQGRTGGIVVSCSDPIVDTDSDLPPHFQTAAYYTEVASNINGSFKVTMEHPNTDKPKPLVIIIGEDGAKIEKKERPISARIATTAPRAGLRRRR
ncbi:MAG: hypothetical protein WAU88_15510 [Candidatus Zixiibacteriota bacterium]